MVARAAVKLLESQGHVGGLLREPPVYRESSAVNPTGSAPAKVVAVAAVSSSPRLAADSANAYAQAFVGFRRESAHAQLSDALAAVRAALECMHRRPTRGGPSTCN